MNQSDEALIIVELITNFVNIQAQLIAIFLDLYTYISSCTSLFESPSSGSFFGLNEEWHFQRHGIGVCFTNAKSEVIIDAHRGMLTFPRAFDPWRLSEYFESINLENISYLSKIYNLSDDTDIEELLNIFEEKNIVTIVDRQPNLYMLKEINNRFI